MQLPLASWGGGGEWSKQLGLGKLQALLRPGAAPPEEASRIPAAHVTVSVQAPARKDLVSVAGLPQTVSECAQPLWGCAGASQTAAAAADCSSSRLQSTAAGDVLRCAALARCRRLLCGCSRLVLRRCWRLLG